MVGSLPRIHPGSTLVAALAIVAGVYSSSIGGDFVWDDQSLIVEQESVHGLRAPAEYFAHMFWRDEQRNFYRPLTTLSFAFDFWRGGGEPLAFHVTNVLLHLACCALVFGLARRAGAGALAAGAATLLFGLLPRLSESVAWISGRTDLLAAMFSLFAIWLYRGGRWRPLASGLCLFAGMLCKEVAAAGVLALVALELTSNDRVKEDWRALGSRLAPALLALAVYLLLRAAALHGAIDDEAEGTSGNFSMLQRLLLAAQAAGTYGMMLVDALRPRLQIGALGLFDPRVAALGLLLAAACAWATVRMWRRTAPLVFAAWFLALMAIAPVLHLVPLAVNVVAADRYLYLPAAGLAIALAGLSGGWTATAAQLAAIAAGLAIPAFGWATVERSAIWRDELSLWQQGLQESASTSGLAHGGMGMALLDRERPGEALPHFREGLEVEKNLAERSWLHAIRNYRVSRSNIALCLEMLGRFDQAIAALDELVRDYPSRIKLRLKRGMAKARALRFDEAERDLEESVRLAPSHEPARRSLALVREVRQALEALPAERPDEPVELSASRARLLDRLGASWHAIRLWNRVARSVSAPTNLLRDAAGYLAFKGGQSDARAALGRLAASGDEGWNETCPLERVLAERFGAHGADACAD